MPKHYKNNSHLILHIFDKEDVTFSGKNSDFIELSNVVASSRNKLWRPLATKYKPGLSSALLWHCILWPKVTTVRCGLNTKHLRGHREAIRGTVCCG